MKKLRIFYDVTTAQINKAVYDFTPNKTNEISDSRCHPDCYNYEIKTWDKLIMSNFNAYVKQINAYFNETQVLIHQLLAAQTDSSFTVVFPELYLRNTDCWEMAELIAITAQDVNLTVYTNNDEIIYGIRRAIVEGFIKAEDVVLITNNKEITFDKDGKPSDEYVIGLHKLSSLI